MQPETVNNIDSITGKEKNDFLKTRIRTLGLSFTTQNALINNGIHTIGGIAGRTEIQLSKVKGIGLKGIEEIKNKLNIESSFFLENSEKVTPEISLKEKIPLDFQSEEEKYDFFKIRIESLCLSLRVENALRSANIRTVGGIMRKNELY